MIEKIQWIFPEYFVICKKLLINSKKMFIWLDKINFVDWPITILAAVTLCQTIVYCATKEKKVYFASVMFDARAKEG